jgi:hypothetical protein
VVIGARHPSWALVANLGLKLALVGLLAFGAFSGLEQFEGKAFGWRLLTYPLAAILVPVVWKLRGSPRPYPHDVDMLLVAPFLVDVVGNTLDLYDTVDWWDDLNHFVNWALLSGAVGAALLRTRLAPVVVFGLVAGFGAAAAILWEVAEYYAFVRGGSEEATAYTDTLGDEVLGFAGAAFAGAIAAYVARRSSERPVP